MQNNTIVVFDDDENSTDADLIMNVDDEKVGKIIVEIKLLPAAISKPTMATALTHTQFQDLHHLAISWQDSFIF